MRKLVFLMVTALSGWTAGYGQRTPDGSLGGHVLITQEQNSVDKTFKDFSMYSPSGFLNGSVITAFNNSGTTKGRRYLFDNWVKGTVTSSSGKIIKTDSFLFNLDKITNGLLVTVDKKNIIEVNKDVVTSFDLTEFGQHYSFVRIDAVNPEKFLQVVTTKQNGYTLYKMLNTHLVKSNYTTNGLVESGNPYDEYVDAPQYFIGLKGGAGVKPVALKRRSIVNVLSGDSQKVNDWFTQYDPDEINEDFLRGLIEQLNQ